jgi:hypothetical protein
MNFTNQAEQIEQLEKENHVLKSILAIGEFSSEQCDFTADPFWIIIIPRQIMKKDPEAIAHCLAHGVWFSRELAQKHLDSRRYEYGDNAIVYGMSGCYSQQYSSMVKAAKKHHAK